MYIFFIQQAMIIIRVEQPIMMITLKLIILKTNEMYFDVPSIIGGPKKE